MPRKKVKLTIEFETEMEEFIIEDEILFELEERIKELDNTATAVISDELEWEDVERWGDGS